MEPLEPVLTGALSYEGGSRPITITPWQEFEIALKKWRFEIF